MSSAIRIIFAYLFSYSCCLSYELNLPDGSPCVSEGVNGTCVSVYRCEAAAYTYIYNRAGYDGDKVPEFPEICSFNGNVPIVCCADSTIFEDEKFKDHVVTPYAALVKKVGPKALDKCLEYFQDAPYPCRGKAVITIIKHMGKLQIIPYVDILGKPGIGGRFAERWEFPHMALLGYGTEKKTAKWLCGGSIISENFILTAGHCTYSRTLGYVTFAALGLLMRSDPLEYWNIYKIKRVIKHPEYKPPSKYNDIALLETENKIQFSQGLLPACLDVGTSEYKSLSADASGWGQLGHKNPLADTLQVMELEKFNERECSSLYPEHRHLKKGFDNATQMCYGSHSRIVDTCQGDSGGPLQINQKKCLYTILGVTSFGHDCGDLGSAGVYTRVLPYVPWIESIVWPD